MVYLSITDGYTLSLGLPLFHVLFYTQLQYLMPMSLMALPPVLLLFFISQRYFVQSIVTTGLKADAGRLRRKGWRR